MCSEYKIVVRRWMPLVSLLLCVGSTQLLAEPAPDRLILSQTLIKELVTSAVHEKAPPDERRHLFFFVVTAGMNREPKATLMCDVVIKNNDDAENLTWTDSRNKICIYGRIIKKRAAVRVDGEIRLGGNCKSTDHVDTADAGQGNRIGVPNLVRSLDETVPAGDVVILHMFEAATRTKTQGEERFAYAVAEYYLDRARD